MTDILNEVASYYSAKLAEHGETPHGVDWNGVESQTLRFNQLSKIFDSSKEISVNDLGCGYGAYFEYLSQKYEAVQYIGLDVSAEMVQAARRRYAAAGNARFVCSDTPAQVVDFGVASGIFNVRLGQSDVDWRAYFYKTLDLLDKTSSKGFSFNCLTSYSDSDRMRSYLYYANPCEVFDHCKKNYSRDVALLHDYGLYEFTILVRKNI